MFESAELGHCIDKQTYDRVVPRLRADLLDAQFDVGALKRFPVLILINGVDGAGKGETVNLLNAWMDPRHILTHAFDTPSDEERERPFMWRYWRALPTKGKIGILFGNWYSDPIVDRVAKRTKIADLDQRIDEINRFERMLADEGVLILKFWFHLSKQAQRQRLKSLEKDGDTRWRVTPEEWQRYKLYDKFRAVSEHTLRHTSSSHAPWTVVEGADERYRSLTVGRILLDAMKKRLARETKNGRQPVLAAAPLVPLALATDKRDLLHALDLGLKLDKKRFDKELEKHQGQLNLLTRDPRFKLRSLIVVFEGWDAAGKGGAIRRVTAALDARHYTTVSVAAPTEEERSQPYLWRFWRRMPHNGRTIIFDRSWYGRVLVERVEGFCSESDWMRAYAEINDFEDQLVSAGDTVVKFWLHISPEEQLKRFKAREKTRFKRFKITSDDWRNRKRWKDYEHAVCDMIDRTSTEIAPWTLIEAEDKYFARIKILSTLCQRLEQALQHDRR